MKSISLADADYGNLEVRTLASFSEMYGGLLKILMYDSREDLAARLGVAEVDDGLYRLCKTLRSALIYQAEPKTLLAILERHISPVGRVNGAAGTETAPEGQSRLVAAVREAANRT